MDGWTDVNVKKPSPFNLVNIKDINGKVQSGWWTGTCWDYGNHRIDKEAHWTKGPFNIVV